MTYIQYKLMNTTVVFVEHHTFFNVYVSYRSQIQLEDENHAVYIYKCSLSKGTIPRLRISISIRIAYADKKMEQVK